MYFVWVSKPYIEKFLQFLWSLHHISVVTTKMYYVEVRTQRNAVIRGCVEIKLA